MVFSLGRFTFVCTPLQTPSGLCFEDTGVPGSEGPCHYASWLVPRVSLNAISVPTRKTVPVRGRIWIEP